MGPPLPPEQKFKGLHAGVQVVVAIASGLVVWLTATDLGSSADHRAFTDFFATAAAVIAALLIALSIEARAAFPLKAYAAVTPALLAIGEISAVAALIPTLPEWTYRWLLTFTVAGGLGGLVAVILAAKMLLERDVQAHRVDELLAAGARSLEEQKKREEEEQ